MVSLLLLCSIHGIWSKKDTDLLLPQLPYFQVERSLPPNNLTIKICEERLQPCPTRQLPAFHSLFGQEILPNIKPQFFIFSLVISFKIVLVTILPRQFALPGGLPHYEWSWEITIQNPIRSASIPSARFYWTPTMYQVPKQMLEGSGKGKEIFRIKMNQTWFLPPRNLWVTWGANTRNIKLFPKGTFHGMWLQHENVTYGRRYLQTHNTKHFTLFDVYIDHFPRK